MIHPAPTTKLDPTLSRAELVEVHQATSEKPASIVICFPNNSYRSSFEIHQGVERFEPLIGEIIIGRVFAKARRVDQPQAGGRKIEPCLGTPRRVMGTVVGVDPAAQVLVVNAGTPVILELTAPGQQATDFANAEFIACDILPGARFELIS